MAVFDDTLSHQTPALLWKLPQGLSVTWPLHPIADSRPALARSIDGPVYGQCSSARQPIDLCSDGQGFEPGFTTSSPAQRAGGGMAGERNYVTAQPGRQPAWKKVRPLMVRSIAWNAVRPCFRPVLRVERTAA